ncbi:MAG: hypothetical protein IJJ33_04540 [Victivallales bacterium]|nr:hypothetical protein [Victivallales bacterium]
MDWDGFLAEARHPDAEWRGAPFWALNGELEPEEMRRQVRGFHECGLGGFFLHARTGLKTPYLSPRWFDCLRAAIDEAEKLGMKAWLYDEDRFPSGAAGGLVTCDPKYRAKGIFLERRPTGEAHLPANTLAVFAAVFDDERIRTSRRLDNPLDAHPDEELLIFYTDTIACSSWYNGYTYLDTLSEEAVARFIEVTHEAYARHFGDKFGTVIPGIFTDEPRYGFLIHQPAWDTETRLALPWSPGVLEKFAEDYGYDPVPRLPEFFFEVEGVDSTAPRVHYVETLQEMFLHAFARQISQWCHAHNLLFTGHVVGEDSLSYQTQLVGSAMRFYEYMDMPGMDLLTEHHRAYLTAKQLASAARQLGKPRRLCECYGCTGWAFPPIGFQAIGDWLAALGVTFRCQHLAFYTMEGEAKRDYPCPVALQSNVPSAYREQEERAARLAKWLSWGRERRGILVISPIESAWAQFHCGWRKEEATLSLDIMFNRLAHLLLARQLDFDFGDEEILARHATCRDGLLAVGEAEYAAVVIPPMTTIRTTTLRLLREFQRLGGQVIALGTPPDHLDGFAASPEWPFPHCPDVEQLPALLEKRSPFRVLSDAKASSQLLCHWREDSEGSVLFMCNTGHPIDDDPDDPGAGYREPAVTERTGVAPEITVALDNSECRCLAEVDLDTGKLHDYPAKWQDGALCFNTSFDRLQSRLFVLSRHELAHVSKAVDSHDEIQRRASVVAQIRCWQVHLSEENVLLLDHFSTDFCGSTYVLELDDLCRDRLGIPRRELTMAQPWTRENAGHGEGRVALRAVFRCEAPLAGGVTLAMERPDLYVCRLNGRDVKLTDGGCWHEPAWRKCRLPDGYVTIGENALELETCLNESHPGLESVFLLGDFSVVRDGEEFALGTPVRELGCGDWCGQGLPFYAGDVTYEAEVCLPRPASARICLGQFVGFPARVEAAGEVCSLPLSPNETPVWSLPARFRLSVTVPGSMRNACGPFWQTEVLPAWCGPVQFKNRKVAERQLMPSGLLAPVNVQEV